MVSSLAFVLFTLKSILYVSSAVLTKSATSAHKKNCSFPFEILQHSLVAMSTFFIYVTAISISLSSAWQLETYLDANNFFDGTYWDFFTSNDPTNGYVNYVDKITANSNGYISSTTPNGEESAYIGCNVLSVSNGRGRDSVRLESKKRYDGGLFMLYLHHMPTGCGMLSIYIYRVYQNRFHFNRLLQSSCKPLSN